MSFCIDKFIHELRLFCVCVCERERERERERGGGGGGGREAKRMVHHLL